MAWTWIDLVIGLGLPVVLWSLHESERLPTFDWRAYQIGVALGLLAELLLFLLGPGSVLPLYAWIAPWPLPEATIPLVHASWAGGVVLVGVRLVRLGCKPPVFNRFRWTELSMLAGWSVGAALMIELAVCGVWWVYIPYGWNPTLFVFLGADITLLPLLIRLTTAILFYGVAFSTTSLVSDLHP